jgi:hypothetical protein
MYPVEYGGTPPEGCDVFHDLVLWDELARTACGGVLAAVFVSMAIALPPILETGSEYIKNKVYGVYVYTVLLTNPLPLLSITYVCD